MLLIAPSKFIDRVALNPSLETRWNCVFGFTLLAATGYFIASLGTFGLRVIWGPYNIVLLVSMVCHGIGIPYLPMLAGSFPRKRLDLLRHISFYALVMVAGIINYVHFLAVMKRFAFHGLE